MQKTYKITILPSNTEFNATTDEYVLTAALNANINLPHGCKDGACKECECTVLSGDYTTDNNKHHDLAENHSLLCKTYAKTDLVLEIPNYNNSFPIKTYPAKVISIKKINNTAILKIKIPPSQKFDFYAGQYIDIILPNKNRSYSIANTPNNFGEIELHVRYHKTGVFSEYVWNELAEGQLMRFKGPLGQFKLQESTNNPILLVCTGTGFAPIKSILEYMQNTNNKRQIQLFWGNRTTNDFYLLESLHDLIKQLNLTVTLCLSQQSDDNYFTGYVTNAVKSKFSDLKNYELYACGNLSMIEDMYNLAVQDLNLDKNNFFSDAFTPST